MTHPLDGRPSWKLLHREFNVSANFAPKPWCAATSVRKASHQSDSIQIKLD